MLRLLTLLCILPLITNAQYQITGTMLRNDSSAAKHLTVKVLKSKFGTEVTSVLTDSLGNFTGSVNDSGAYDIQIKSVFYRDTTVKRIYLSEGKLQSILVLFY
jgi:hypothetical protein